MGKHDEKYQKALFGKEIAIYLTPLDALAIGQILATAAKTFNVDDGSSKGRLEILSVYFRLRAINSFPPDITLTELADYLDGN